MYPPEEGFGETWFPVDPKREAPISNPTAFNLHERGAMTIEVPDDCEDWIGWLADSFEQLDRTLPEVGAVLRIDEEWPDWVTNLVRELISTLYPAARLTVAEKWTPEQWGAFTGQRIAYFQRLCEPDPWPGFDLEKARLAMKEEERAMAERWADAFAEHVGKVYELTAAALALGLIQSHAESASFMTAFARGLAMKPADMFASNFERTTTRIYWFLFRYWPSVQKLGSARELQQVLCRYFETIVVGDQKRIEKMCQRLGLRFGPPVSCT